jgi:alpha-galactosidase
MAITSIEKGRVHAMANHHQWAATPPLGWNSWDCYGAAVTEEEVRGNAQYMAKHLKPYGWEYVVVDIQWYEPGAISSAYRPYVPLEMDAFSRLLPAVNRFPSAADGQGFKPLADYVHSLGLKFGIHIMRGIPRQAVHADTPLTWDSCKRTVHCKDMGWRYLQVEYGYVRRRSGKGRRAGLL